MRCSKELLQYAKDFPKVVAWLTQMGIGTEAIDPPSVANSVKG